MPKTIPFVSDHALILPDTPLYGAIPVGSAFYFTVLNDEVDSFRYEDDRGVFTLRKVTARLKKKSKKGGKHYYWLAYRRVNTRLRKLYVGLTESLTIERLDDISEEIHLDDDTFWAIREEKRQSSQSVASDRSEEPPQDTRSIEELKEQLNAALKARDVAVTILLRAIHINKREVSLIRSRMRDVVEILCTQKVEK